MFGTWKRVNNQEKAKTQIIIYFFDSDTDNHIFEKLVLC